MGKIHGISGNVNRIMVMGIFICNYYEILYNTKYWGQNWSQPMLESSRKTFFSL